VVFPYSSYKYHLDKYGDTTRKYLKYDDFYDKHVVNAIESANSLVYPELKYDKAKRLKPTGSYHFYYPIPNPYFVNKKTGERVTEFLKVTVKKDKQNLIIIITPYKTTHINQKKFIDKKICQAITKL
jgi:hypothetical protein